MKKNIIILKFQLALFFKEIENRPDKLFNKINDDLKLPFTEMPNIVGLPKAAPLEIPIVAVKDDKHFRALNIGRLRLDYYKSTFNKSIDEDLNSFILDIKEFVSISEKYKNIFRFGFIAEYFIEIQDPIGYVYKTFYKKSHSNLVEISFRINERIILGDNNYNLIKNIQAFEKDYDNKGKKGILFQMDFNNVPSDNIILVTEILHSIEREKIRFTEASIKEAFNG